MKAFGRAEQRKHADKIVFDGTNGNEIVEWSRDQDTIARFQHRPDLPGEKARVLVHHPHPEWLTVPVGATITKDEHDNLILLADTEENPA